MKTIQELVSLIQEWAKEREIYEQLTPFDELLKTHEEVGELIKAKDITPPFAFFL